MAHAVTDEAELLTSKEEWTCKIFFRCPLAERGEEDRIVVGLRHDAMSLEVAVQIGAVHTQAKEQRAWQMRELQTRHVQGARS